MISALSTVKWTECCSVSQLTIMLLVEAFIQSNLHCTQGVNFSESLHEFPVNQTYDLGAAYATEQQEHIIQSKWLI